jgi:hypothetical protein
LITHKVWEVTKIEKWEKADRQIMIPVDRTQFTHVSFLKDMKTERSWQTHNATT